MNIYIDESGSFVSATSRGSWNAVVAYAVPEVSRKGLERAVGKVRTTTRVGAKEVKLNEIDEQTYFLFLVQLGKLNGVLFCTATDAGLNTSANVVAHQAGQVAKILEHIDKMKFEGGRQAVTHQIAHQITLSRRVFAVTPTPPSEGLLNPLRTNESISSTNRLIF